MRPTLTLTAWASLTLVLSDCGGGRDIRNDLYPNSRVIIHRRYSPYHLDIAGTNRDPLTAIAAWYDSRFRAQALVDEQVSASVWKKRWRISGGFLEVCIVEHGGRRSILVRDSSGY